MFWRKKKKEELENKGINHIAKAALPEIDFTEEILDQDERDELAVIASSILSSNYTDAKVHVKSVRRVDQDKRAAALIAAAILANDKPESTFRLVSIKERSKTNA